MFIRTERLFLRPAWPEDWHELHTTIADERIVRNLARAPWPYTQDDARAFVAAAQDRRHPRFLITIPSASGARIVGGIGLTHQDRQAELGYWLAPEAWGRGLATEAASAVLRLARTLGHSRIGAHHFLDNPASGRVLEKVGFRRTGHVAERPSLARGCSFPSREYLLDFGFCNDSNDDALGDECHIGMRAA